MTNFNDRESDESIYRQESTGFEDTTLRNPPSRRWGVDVLGVLYIAVGGLALATFRDPSPLLTAFVLAAAVVSIAIGIGFLARYRPARTVFLGLLWVSLGLSLLLCLFYIAEWNGWIDDVKGVNPKRALLRTVSRMAMNVYLIGYLNHEDVKAEFIRRTTRFKRN